MKKSKRLKGLKIRPAVSDDIPAVYRCQRLAYSGLADEALCDERLLHLQQTAFPAGFLVAEFEGQIVGYTTSLIVQLDSESPWYSYEEITGGGAFTTHNPAGDTLYGADIAVLPALRGRGVASALYKARKRLLRRFNLRRMVAGGRIPGYAAVADTMSAEEYVERVVSGELRDSSLNTHLKAGYTVQGVHHGYLEDEQSLDYATFLEYLNPDFKADRHRRSAVPLKRRYRKVRICLAQSALGTLDNFEGVVERLNRTLAESESRDTHLLVLPMGWCDGLSNTEWRSRKGELEELLGREASARGMFIVSGPRSTLGSAVAVYGPEGVLGTQGRLHVSKDERSSELCVFNTAIGRLGVLSGYDVVFPELTRRLTLAGLQILVCPVKATERNEYLRVRHCAQARAIENTIFVALCNGGAESDYGESVIFTPCDFGFPDSGVAARAGTFGQALVVYDLDLGALENAREIGTVTPLKDRRVDLCGLSEQVRVKVVKDG